MPTIPHMRINIPQIVEKSPKRRARFLAEFLRNQILNNYDGLRQHLATSSFAQVDVQVGVAGAGDESILGEIETEAIDEEVRPGALERHQAQEQREMRERAGLAAASDGR